MLEAKEPSQGGLGAVQASSVSSLASVGEGPLSLGRDFSPLCSNTYLLEKRRSVDHGEVRDEPVAFPQDPAALPVNGRRSPAPSPKGAATEALPPPVGSPWVSR